MHRTAPGTDKDESRLPVPDEVSNVPLLAIEPSAPEAAAATRSRPPRISFSEHTPDPRIPPREVQTPLEPVTAVSRDRQRRQSSVCSARSSGAGSAASYTGASAANRQQRNYAPLSPEATPEGHARGTAGYKPLAAQEYAIAINAAVDTDPTASLAASFATSNRVGKIGDGDSGSDDGGGTQSNISRDHAPSEGSFEESLASVATGATGKASSSGGTSSHIKVCGTRIKVPFTAWTFLAMSVPITMLLITTVWPMADALSDQVLVNSMAGFARDVSDCVTALGREDFTLHNVLYRRNPATAEQRRAAYATARAAVDATCDGALLSDLRTLAQQFDSFVMQRDEFRASFHDLTGQRALMDAQLASGNVTEQRRLLLAGMRPAVDTTMFRVTNAIADVAAKVQSKTSRLFIDLNLVGIARGKLWLAVSTGNARVSTDAADDLTATADEEEAMIRATAAATVTRNAVEAAASVAIVGTLATWSAQPATIEMFAVLKAIGRLGGTQTTTTSSTLSPSNSSNATAAAVSDTEAFEQLTSGPLAELRQIEAYTLELIGDAKATQAAVIKNAALLGAGLVLSAIAAGLLARQQLKIQAVLRTQVTQVERTKRAVSAFVPRFFLNKMGYTSITHVSVGDSAEVALTMLFADIRDFTTVAEGMTSTTLFNWVQGYFRLMTTIIEGHHGNINQFIGDALFALFSTAKDGVVCAVEMQAKTQQLNLQRLCVEGNTVPLNIGVGLHHDVLSLGILGDARRHTCTAISASVNMASRLEGLTKQLGCRILASEAVIDQLGPDARGATKMRLVGSAVVKGSGSDVPVYDIFQADERAMQRYKSDTLASFEQYTKLRLRPAAAATDGDRAEVARLRSQLDQRASELGVTDDALRVMDETCDAATGRLVFDHK